MLPSGIARTTCLVDASPWESGAVHAGELTVTHIRCYVIQCGADRGTVHTALADEAVCLGSRATLYTDIPALLKVFDALLFLNALLQLWQYAVIVFCLYMR